jgi:C4-type Zn-finger protein
MGRNIVSDLQRARIERADLPSCTRCNADMIEILTIAPMFHEPGLIAYECPKCGYVTSHLLPPESGSQWQ